MLACNGRFLRALSLHALRTPPLRLSKATPVSIPQLGTALGGWMHQRGLIHEQWDRARHSALSQARPDVVQRALT